MKNEMVVVNGQSIECPFENEQHYVAIRQICDALGIDYRKQFERIKNDEILKDVVTDTVTASDKIGRGQKMVCLPLEFVFGWIFTIDDSKVNDKAKPTFVKYKLECYKALYNHFYGATLSRKKTLLDKAAVMRQIKEKEEALKSNETYQELMELKGKIMKSGKDLKQMDLLLAGQMELFDEVDLGDNLKNNTHE
jgi:P22_AR N-terminal domain